MKLVIPVDLESRLVQIPILAVYGIVSFLVYFYVNYKNGNLVSVFGNRIDDLFKKFIR